MNLNIPILMYHQISREPHPNFLEYTVTPKAFEAQMKALKFLGFVPITFSKLLDYKNGSAKPPSKPVIITFDDGLQDAIDNAVPILESTGFTAVFYIPTDYAGRKSSWMIPEVNVEFQIIDWATVTMLDSMGFEVASHSMSHPRLSKISSNDCFGELSGSRRKLEEILGHEVRHIAYPYGDYNESVKILASEAGYYTACTTEESFVDLDNDMFALPRFNMGVDISMLNFLCKINTADSPIGIMAKQMLVMQSKVPGSVKKIFKRILHSKNILLI
ncbi:MAG: polysaccharide deacetylase family protein [Thermodesulfobacteriota bacterium]